MRTRYEYIVKSVKYPLDKLVYEAYKDKLAKYGEVEFKDGEVHLYTRNLSFVTHNIGCSVIIQSPTKWQKIPYLVLWDKTVIYTNELYPV